ncbi:MAG: ATP-binding protein [Patescibacteria group bacterium]
MNFTPTVFSYIVFTGVFTVVVATIFLFEFRRIRKNLETREQEMIQRMYQLSILRELGERIGYSLKIHKIVEIIAGSLRRLLAYSTVAYMLLTTTAEGKRKVIFNVNLEKPVSKKFLQEVKNKMLQSFGALVGKELNSEEIEDTITGTITDPTSAETVGSFFNVPIVIGGNPVGLLNISDTAKNRFKEKDVEILYTIMQQASDAVAKLEHVLKVEKGKLNSMVASMADGVIMIDNQKQLSVINPAAIKMLGLGQAAAAPSIFDILDVLSSKLDLRTRLEESIAQDKLVIIPAVNLSNQFLQILISPVKDEQKRFMGAVVLFHNITKEKELEKMREDFTNMMVHELRSPLTGIKSIAGLLADARVKDDAKKYKEFISLISSNSQDMLGLVNDLLDVAKLESGKFQILKKKTNIRQMIETRVNSFKALAEQANLKIIVHLSQALPAELEFDEHKIAQALNNFISNAVKFTAAGGSITVSAFVLPKGKDLASEVVEQSLIWPGVKAGVKFNSEELVIAVTDTGVGIPQSNISQLFNKFVQLENAARSEKKGTGLGLVITKGIVEAHKGNLGVFSEEGEGSTFYFSLPTVDVGVTVQIPQSEVVQKSS